VDSLVYHYRALGHRIAAINPLGDNPTTHPDLDLSGYGIPEDHLGRVYDTNHIPDIKEAPLSEIVEIVRDTYCGFVGVEYMHIQETAERRWLQQRMETGRNRPRLTPGHRQRILFKLQRSEMFEHFLHSNYRGQKRFSLEGAETLIPAIDHVVEKAPALGIVEIVFGMAHRGRLNVLANVFEKSYDEIFSEFEDNFLSETYHGDGDVKYHKGYSNDVPTLSGARIHLSLVANPSHLEAVGPVVEGKTRAKQAERNDTARKAVLPFIIHGDAAFAGQGIVAETFNLSQLKGYRTGGTIHFIVNNQVGFTTSPQDYQSTTYSTDVAKIVGVPIFHVNGDHPEHVVHVMDMAIDYRQTFGKDVVIDMWCYRRHGHNEGDDPSFTQPLLYARIAKHPSVVELYTRELTVAGELKPGEAEGFAEEFGARLEEAKKLAAAGQRKPSIMAPFGGRWKDLKRDYSHEPVKTGVSYEALVSIARKVATIPDGFNVNRKIRRIYDEFLETVESRGALNWAGAEILAFGSLLLEGTGVRLSGEDSRRGTFSQRHAALLDQETGEMHIPLTCLDPGQASFCVYDSSLAEASVLGFDYGYSLGDPYRLILWEAQFGDFSNGAQVIIDQFIAGAISKWNHHSGLVMLLPHGYEGQGPEHSNAWISRYLRLCGENNMELCQPTTPAQYFHLLRRQVRRNFRRPLIMFTPKSMLRNPLATSPVEDLTRGHFQEVLDDPRGVAAPRRVLFCSGKAYFELDQARQERGIDDIAIVRVEQFYPIWDAQWEELERKYLDVPEWVWVSEEPTNFGAWGFMHANLGTHHDGEVWFVGRARSASPATASLFYHKRQQKVLVDFALKPGPLVVDLIDGVAAFTRGEELWHLKSRSPLSESPSQKAPSQVG
jgi:2-oxoglutarate dehydrogenase E1 component